MKKLLMGLMLVSSVAHADWIMYGDNGKAEFYYDDKTINTSGGTVSVWEMLSYSFPLNACNRIARTKSINAMHASSAIWRVSFSLSLI